MAFGDKLKALRTEKGLTQTALAVGAGLTLQGIGQLERGRREPAWATVQVIAKALGVSCELFADEGIEMPTTEAAAPGKRGRPRKPVESPESVGDADASPTAIKPPVDEVAPAKKAGAEPRKGRKPGGGGK